ncbi:MAG: twin-arginine translocation signal domain-containing protein, partial [Pseudohongiellaceae bacterium]
MQKNKTFGRRDILKAAGAGALAAALSSCQAEISSG